MHFLDVAGVPVDNLLDSGTESDPHSSDIDDLSSEKGSFFVDNLLGDGLWSDRASHDGASDDSLDLGDSEDELVDRAVCE